MACSLSAMVASEDGDSMTLAPVRYKHGILYDAYILAASLFKRLHAVALYYRSPNDSQASLTRDSGGCSRSACNGMKCRSATDKVAIYEEEELQSKDDDSMCNTGTAKSLYMIPLKNLKLHIGALCTGDILC